jgi:Domain of unknown function (DUF1707)
MTRRYDVRTGMLENDPDAELPREHLVPGWRVPGHSRYDCDLRIGDAERDATMTQLREHFAAGRLTLDEVTERIDLALAAKTRGQIDGLMADLPQLPSGVVAESQEQGLDHEAGRFVVLALLLFVLASWMLMMVWMSRHAYSGPYPNFPGQGH